MAAHHSGDWNAAVEMERARELAQQEGNEKLSMQCLDQLAFFLSEVTFLYLRALLLLHIPTYNMSHYSPILVEY